MKENLVFIFKNNLRFLYILLLSIRKLYRSNYHKLIPYYYYPNKYENSFLNNNLDKRIPVNDIQKIDRVIYCFWTGNNEITKNRKDSLIILEKNTGIKVKLITIDNLSNYILPDFPLHPSYQYLSLVHKSDYLRCYFMYHYGGGYSDIKRNYNNWEDVFNDLENQSDKYIAGYPEFDPTKMGGKGENIALNNDIFKYYKLCIGNCGFICKPYSIFVAEWYQELHEKLDLFYVELEKTPGIGRGFNEGYPIGWFDILSKIMVPLSLKHHKKIVYDKRLMPDFMDYL